MKIRENQISDMAEAIYRVGCEMLGELSNEQTRHKTEYTINQWSDLIFQCKEPPLFSVSINRKNRSRYTIIANDALGLEVLKTVNKTYFYEQ